MRKIILGIFAIFTFNLSALELTDMLKDIGDGDDYRTCLNHQYSMEFCRFSREYAWMLFNMTLMARSNEPREAIDRYMSKIMSSYVCYHYRTMNILDKNLIDEIYFNGVQNTISKEQFDAVCY